MKIENAINSKQASNRSSIRHAAGVDSLGGLLNYQSFGMEIIFNQSRLGIRHKTQ